MKSLAQCEFWVPIQPVNFLRAGEKTKISNFILWFYVKDKLLRQKTERVVYCPETEGLLKVSAQSEGWFPIQPSKKWVNFF